MDSHTLFYDKRKFHKQIFLSKNLGEMLGFFKTEIEHIKYRNLKDLLTSHFNEEKKDHKPLYFPEDLDSFSDNDFTNTYLNMEFNNDTIYSNFFDNNDDEYIKSNHTININHSLPTILGLRTNLSKPDIFKNCVYDTQVVFINVKDHPEGIQIFSDKNPLFFETTLDKISNAKFELIDIKTGKVPNFTIGTPTYIQVIIKNTLKMRPRFNVFLDSSDEVSQHFFPHNNPSDFTIKFPERLEFNKQWEVTLKNIFIGNDLYNIYKDSCWMKVFILQNAKADDDLSGSPSSSDLSFYEKHITLKDGKYKSIDELCAYIQTLFEKENLKLKIDLKNEHVRIRCYEEKITPVLVEFTLTFSPHLSNILGIDLLLKNENSIHFDNKNKFLATFKPNISLLTPTNFIVLCDVVSNSVFGSKSINILKLLSVNFNPMHELIQFSFYQDEFVDLNIKEFSSIRIRIVDTTGDLIKSEQSHPTRCQIQFLKHEV